MKPCDTQECSSFPRVSAQVIRARMRWLRYTTDESGIHCRVIELGNFESNRGAVNLIRLSKTVSTVRALSACCTVRNIRNR